MTVVDNKDSDPHLPAAYLSAIGDAIDTCRDELRTLSLKMCRMLNLHLPRSNLYVE